MSLSEKLSHVRQFLDSGLRYYKAREAVYDMTASGLEDESAQSFLLEKLDAQRQHDGFLAVIDRFDKAVAQLEGREDFDELADVLSTVSDGESGPSREILADVVQLLRSSSEWTARFRKGIPPHVTESDIPALVDALECGTAVVRQRAARRLGEFGANSAPAIRALLDQLHDATEDASHALVRIGDAAVETLGAVLTSGDEFLSAEVAKILVRIGTPKAAESLNDLLESDHPQASSDILSALVSAEDGFGLQQVWNAVRSQVDRLASSSHGRVRRIAHEAVERFSD